jgi:hypothetical protein
MKPFFLVLARDKKYVDEKIKELKSARAADYTYPGEYVPT